MAVERFTKQEFETIIEKWQHCAILLGYIAEEYGADVAEIEGIIQADKAEIDQRLKRWIAIDIKRWVAIDKNIKRPIKFTQDTK